VASSGLAAGGARREEGLEASERPVARAGAIQRDRVEPSLEARLPAEVLEPPVRAEERLLDDVLGLHGPDETGREREEGRLVMANDLLEADDVAR
jgi:hypothetical protein